MGFEYQSLATGLFQMPDGWKLTTIQKVAQVNEAAVTIEMRLRIFSTSILHLWIKGSL